jgi:hypothetical protein
LIAGATKFSASHHLHGTCSMSREPGRQRTAIGMPVAGARRHRWREPVANPLAPRERGGYRHGSRGWVPAPLLGAATAHRTFSNGFGIVLLRPGARVGC